MPLYRSARSSPAGARPLFFLTSSCSCSSSHLLSISDLYRCQSPKISIVVLQGAATRVWQRLPFTTAVKGSIKRKVTRGLSAGTFLDSHVRSAAELVARAKKNVFKIRRPLLCSCHRTLTIKHAQAVCGVGRNLGTFWLTFNGRVDKSRLKLRSCNRAILTELRGDINDLLGRTPGHGMSRCEGRTTKDIFNDVESLWVTFTLKNRDLV